MAGFSTHHPIGKLQNVADKVLKKNQHWKPQEMYAKKGKGNHWKVVVKSKTLDKLASQMKKNCFHHIKKHFHITLPHVSSEREAKNYVNNLKGKDWFFHVCEKPANSIKNCSWKNYIKM